MASWPCAAGVRVLIFGGWNLLYADRMPLIMFTRKTLVLEVSTHCGVAAV